MLMARKHPPGTAGAAAVRRRSGQAIIESAIIILLTALLLFGLLQIGLLFVGREVLDHAATAGARARAVGFNDFMVHKTVRAAAIANAGPLIEPDPRQFRTADDGRWGEWRVGALWNLALRGSPRSPQAQAEISRIPLYLGTERWEDQFAILNYEHWNTIVLSAVTDEENLVGVRVRQRMPLTMPFRRAFYAGDSVNVVTSAWQANYAETYLE